jgi:hypothetical protein
MDIGGGELRVGDEMLDQEEEDTGDGAVLTDQLGTPKGRCDEHIRKFSLSMKPKFNRPVGERNHF